MKVCEPCLPLLDEGGKIAINRLSKELLLARARYHRQKEASLLFRAAKQCDHHTMKTELEKGIDPNGGCQELAIMGFRKRVFASPVLMVVLCRRELTDKLLSLRMLLDHGADINNEINRIEVLHSACTGDLCHEHDVLEFLLENGIQIRSQQEHVQLKKRIVQSKSDSEAVKKLCLLLRHPMESGSSNKETLEEAVRCSNAEGVRFLLEAGSQPTDTAMVTACSSSNFQSHIMGILVLNILIEFNGNVNAEAQGRTALNRAIHSYKFELVECLLRSGADPNLCNEDGRSPLNIARTIHGRDSPFGKILLRFGAVEYL